MKTEIKDLVAGTVVRHPDGKTGVVTYVGKLAYLDRTRYPGRVGGRTRAVDHVEREVRRGDRLPRDRRDVVRARCHGHFRHWFTVHGFVGLRSPKCVRCGASNPTPLTTDDWWDLLENAPELLDDPAAIRRQLEDERQTA